MEPRTYADRVGLVLCCRGAGEFVSRSDATLMAMIRPLC
jgi:hypothetical protein